MTAADQSLFDPTQLILELEPATLEAAWKNQNTANSSSHWQSYLNQIVLNVFLPWLQAEEDATAKAGFNKATQADIWEVVNGTAIKLKDAKLILIPTEAEDLSELRVAQEWVDIPGWTADYYLAVQVNVDAGYVRIWGYTTHQKLKNNGNFNQSDRTYSLNNEQLITDINVLWVARELCPQEVTQVAVAPIAAISQVQAENLIERLGSQSQLLPRLAVPFSTWAALMQNTTWCRNLAKVRRGVPAKAPILQWLQQGVRSLSAELGWRQIKMTPSIGARGVATSEATKDVPIIGLAKQIAIANQPYELRILPLSEAGSWRFELCCLTPGCMIPSGFKLKLLTVDLKEFAGNEHLATEPVEQLFIEVDLEPGESLVCQVKPTPDNYQAEVWQF